MKPVHIHHGDSRDVLKTMPDCSVDSVCTDPPYALVSIQKRFGKPGSAPAKGNDAYMRASKGFMSVSWDTGETAFDPEFWADVLRVLKPGGHVVAFSGTRTYHRMASAIEDAGFEIRDQLAWAFGSGFPKSHNQKGDWEGWGTALKPAWEPICLARKMLIGTVAANLAAHGTGALNIDGCRIDAPQGLTTGGARHGSPLHMDRAAGINRVNERSEAHAAGRWPANVLHDGSEEVVEAFPAQTSVTGKRSDRSRDADVEGTSWLSANHKSVEHLDSGSAARFFYSAKADPDDRLGSKHPTVKPIDLMRWLCRLVTPPGGVVLDPFAGSGSTGVAAMLEGFESILIEREADYIADIKRKVAFYRGEGRLAIQEKGKAKNEAANDLPLFQGDAA